MIDTIALLQAIFTTKNIIIYLIVINLITFLVMLWDKHEAKVGEWRVSEKTLFIFVLMGGGIGGIAGMYAFRHKTKKWYFKYGFPTILVTEIIAAVYLIIKYKH